MTTLILATANPHKSEEMRAILQGLNIEVLERPENLAEVEETSDTLEGNALLKARAIVAATGQVAVADDTGLFVDALGGRPGVFSSRYAGQDASYADNVNKLLEEMGEVAPGERTARFRTVIVVAYPEGEWFSVEGVLEGAVLSEPKGDRGFGYDPVFVPRGSGGRSLAEMTSEEKNSASHRAIALRALAEELSSR